MARNRSGDGVSIEIVDAVSDTFSSALALAKALGSAVLEPTWWPADLGQVEYVLDRWPDDHDDQYRIGSIRHDGRSTYVICHRAVPGAGRAAGEWYAPAELATVRGLIGRVGIPPRLQAVVYRDGSVIHLMGYETEDEIIRTVGSLRKISAD